MCSILYEKIKDEFVKRNCKLLTSEEEQIELAKKYKHYRLKYIASCGHEHIVFYNVFKSRNTGILCPSCKNKEIGNNIKNKIINKELTPNYGIEQENEFIAILSDFLKNDFQFKKAFDGCLVDVMFKPKNVSEDNWVGIQIKTTKNINLTYSFHINSNYTNCLILLYCFEDKNMWLIPENTIHNQKKISIGINKSKYSIYNIKYEMLAERLNILYYETTNFNFDKLNTPINIYQQREKEFRKIRENAIKFINFENSFLEGTVYDFKIGNFKIQEKVAKLNENWCTFQLCKNGGRKKIIQYDIDDNDFYWLNSDNKKNFLLLHKSLLIERGFIGNNPINKNKMFIKINMENYADKWYGPYMFEYNTISQEENKQKLCNLLNI